MIESKNEANKNLEKALRTLAQAKQKVGGGKDSLYYFFTPYPQSAILTL